MEIKKIVTGALEENCYILSKDGTQLYWVKSDLTEVNIPESVETIKSNALLYVKSQEIELPKNVKRIESTILNLSSLTEMETDSLMKEVGFTMENKASPSFSSSCERFGIQKNAWDNYRIDNFFEINYKS